MWEFSISVLKENESWAKHIYDKLKQTASEFGSIVTTSNSEQFSSVLIACEDFDKVRMQYAVNDEIIFTISSLLKEKFLTKYLSVPLFDERRLIALKKALLAFDRDTDIHLIQKYLSLEKSIFIESFFDFKLYSLKSKWFELVRLANDNSGFLVSDETFCELLRFLVENLEVSLDQVSVLCEDDKFTLFDGSFNELGDENIDENSVISILFSLCPKNIDFYSNDDESEFISLVQKIFSSRVKVLPKRLFQKSRQTT